MSNRDKVAGMAAYVRLRKAGVPTLVTADEAYRMSNGVIGTKGDHGATGAIPLSRVALLAPESQPLTEGE